MRCESCVQDQSKWVNIRYIVVDAFTRKVIVDNHIKYNLSTTYHLARHEYFKKSFSKKDHQDVTFDESVFFIPELAFVFVTPISSFRPEMAEIFSADWWDKYGRQQKPFDSIRWIHIFSGIVFGTIKLSIMWQSK